MLLFWVISLLCLCSCEKQDTYLKYSSKDISYNWQRINSRDEGDPSARYPLYIARVPSDWIRKDPAPNESISNTIKSLCEFLIKEEDQEVRILIHNFSSNNLDQRIPP